MHSRSLLFTLALAATLPLAAQDAVVIQGQNVALPALALAETMPGQAVLTSYYSSQGWLGVGLADLTSASLARLHVASVNGAEVVEVYPDSPAATAGLKPNDVITSFNGDRVSSVRQLERLVEETPSDRNVSLAVMRDGKPLQLDVSLRPRAGGTRALTLGSRWTTLAPRAPAMTPLPPTPPMPPMPRMAPDNPLRERLLTLESQMGTLGLSLESLTPQLASYFGLPSGQSGLLVRSVEADTPAAKAGINAGDVLTRLGANPIASVGDLNRAIRAAAGSSAAANLLRRGKEINLTLSVPARPQDWM